MIKPMINYHMIVKTIARRILHIDTEFSNYFNRNLEILAELFKGIEITLKHH
jgi:hypothetical protein